MDQPEIKYSTTVYYSNKLAQLLLFIFPLWIALVMFILRTVVFDGTVQYLVLIFAFALPFFFKKPLRNYYARNILCTFSPSAIQILETNSAGKQTNYTESYFLRLLPIHVLSHQIT